MAKNVPHSHRILWALKKLIVRFWPLAGSVSSRESCRQADEAEEHQTSGQRLIRVPIEELREAKSEKTWIPISKILQGAS